jgi:diguanylate cyclase (GGDEF)-like protein
MASNLSPLKAGFLSAATLVVALGGFGFAYAQLGVLQEDLRLAAEGRDLAAARMAQSYLELKYPGAWKGAPGGLLKGGERIVEGQGPIGALADSLPEGSRIRVGLGAAPAASGAALSSAGAPFPIEGGACFLATARDGTVLGWVSITSDAEFALLRPEAVRLALLLFLGAASGVMILSLGGVALRAVARGYARPRKESSTDPATGLLSRAGLERELGSAIRSHGLTHLAMLALDGLEALIEERGEEEGDRALAELGRVLGSTLRAADLYGRWDGGQFLVAYRGLAREHAAASGERLRSAVERRDFGGPSAPFRMTVTVGLATVGESGFAGALEAARGAMLRGKGAGLNRVVLA